MSSTGARILFQSSVRQRCYQKIASSSAATRMANSILFSCSRGFSTYPPHEIVPMPGLSPTMETGTISKWNLNEGDEFDAGDVLCEVETDKATVDFEAQDEGVIAKILVEEGKADIPCGQPILITVMEKSDVDAFKDYTVEGSGDIGKLGLTVDKEEDAASPPPSAADAAPLGEHVLSPSARHITVSKGLDGSVLYPGSGKQGRITKGDVVKAIKEGTLPKLSSESSSSSSSSSSTSTNTYVGSSPIAATTTAPIPSIINVEPQLPDVVNYTDVPNTSMRKIIAKRLTQSKAEVPHFYSSYSVPLDNIMSLRKRHNANLSDAKISVNDYIVKAASLALRDIPQMNSQFNPKDSSITKQPSVDISIAVATPNGLITPIVPNCDKMSLYDVNQKIKDLATRARDNKLLPHEFQGGTFTISNLGMFGIAEFSAVINPPQCAILAVGGGSPEMVPGDEEGTLKKETRMNVKLSADRRVVDEPTAALFLQCLGGYLADPELMLL